MKVILMLDHLLVPLDQSPLAEQALEYAREIIAPHGKITLVTVLDNLVVYRYGHEVHFPRDVEDNLIKKAEAYLSDLGNNLRRDGINVELLVRVGTPDRIICRVAISRNVNAIVMSTHGRGGFGRLIFGSVTRSVLEKSTCPVLVVPNQQKVSARV